MLSIVALAMVAAACAGGAADEPGGAEPSVPSTTSTAVAPGASTAPSTSSTSTQPAAPAPDGPSAPDFSLALADGGTFVLSQEQKPVYLIFWAEW